VLAILVVDDDDLIRRVLTRGFEREGHTVCAVADSNEAMALAGPFDLGIFDINLGGEENGVVLAERLLSARTVQRVVFFTSEREPATLTEATRIGTVIHDAERLRELVRKMR
jgi:two-component system, NtrC family, response regulator AlgB